MRRLLFLGSLLSGLLAFAFFANAPSPPFQTSILLIVGVPLGAVGFGWLVSVMAGHPSPTAFAIAYAALTCSVGQPQRICFVKRMAMLAMGSLSHVVGFALKTIAFCAVLPCGVSHVIGLRSKKKMSGIATRRIVALVADLLAFGNRTMSQLIRQAMRQNATGGTNTENAITPRQMITDPRPTGIRTTRTIQFEIQTFFGGRHEQSLLSLSGT